MKLKTMTMTAILGPMTAMERARGRYMRAPDHPGGDGGQGGGNDGGSSGGDGSADGSGGDDTASRLAKEFGDDATGDADGGDGSDDGDGEEDLGSHDDGDDGDGDGSDGQGSDGEGDGEGDDSGDGEGDGQPQNRSEQRIKEHEAARREAERKASEATREAEKWRRIAEGAPQLPEAVAEGEKDPNAEPDPADFEFGAADPEYIAAKAEWGAINRLRAEGENARIMSELTGLEAKYQSGVPAALEKYPDYDDVVTKGAEKKEGEDGFWPCPPIVALGIRDSEVGHEIAYHLAKNPSEASRIAALGNIEQAREFGRLEGKFMNSTPPKKAGDDNKGDGNGAPPAPRKRTAAPPPPKNNVARGSGGKFTTPADTDDFAAFDRAVDSGQYGKKFAVKRAD